MSDVSLLTAVTLADCDTLADFDISLLTSCDTDSDEITCMSYVSVLTAVTLADCDTLADFDISLLTSYRLTASTLGSVPGATLGNVYGRCL